MIMAKDSHGNYVEIEDIKQQDSFKGISPINFKSNGDNLKNYRIYGNTVNGEGVGDRTANLFDGNFLQGYRAYADGRFTYTSRWICTNKIPCTGGQAYTYSFSKASRWFGFVWYDGDGDYISTNNRQDRSNTQYRLYYAEAPSNAEFMVVNIAGYPSDLEEIFPIDVTDFMLVEGQYTIETMPAYEPYGYRVPVTVTNGTDTQTTNLYLPEQIKKVGDEAEYIDYGEQKQHRVRKNLLQNTATSQTINGITFTVNDDGSVTCNGTATKITSIILNNNLNIDESTILSGCPINGGVDSYLLRFISLSPTIINEDVGSGTIINNFRIGNIEIRIASGYACDNLTFYPMIRKADILDDIYEPYITDADIDVTLPALPTLSGTNTLSVNTNIKPSKVWGGLNDPRDILYVKDKLGNILFSKYYEIEDEPPLIYRAKKAGTLKDYRIYGNTVDGESVGDRTGNLFDKDNMGNGIMNSYINSDGTTVPNQQQWIVTQYIPCNSNVITIKFDTAIGNYPSICLYDDNKNYITGAKYQGSATITVTTEYAAKYIRFSYTRLTDLSKIMLNSGSTALPYEPYGYKVPVTVEGKNLLKNIATSQIINGITFTVNDDKSITVFGELTGTNATFVIANSSDIPGRFDHSSAIISKGLMIISTTTNDSIQLRAQYTDDMYKGIMTNGVPFTIPKDIGMVYIQVTESLPEPVTIYPMIRKADITDDTYEPYHAPVTTPIYLPEQIRKVGDEAEYIDYGEQKMHRVRKNLLQNTATSQKIGRDESDPETYPGVTFTVNDDKSVTCNGASNRVTYIYLCMDFIPEEGITYLYSGCPQDGNIISYELDLINSSGIIKQDIGNGITFDSTSRDGYLRVRLRIGADYTCNNLTFYPMIRKADITDDTYEPYIEDTELNIIFPALPTLSGTNTLSVETGIQPSDIYLKGKIEKKPKIYYYSQDGQTLLYTESVLKGGNGAYSTTPTKPSTAQYNYTSVGWAA